MFSVVAFQKYQEVEHQADTPVFPLAMPSQRDHSVLTELHFFSFYPWESVKRPFCAHRARFCLPHQCRATALAILASLTAIIMLISMCSFARRKTKRPQFVSRKLAGNKSIPSRGPGICEDTPGESNASSSDEGSPLVASLDVTEPSAKRLKIVLGEDGCDEAAAGPSELFSPYRHRREKPAKREAQASQPDHSGPHASVQEVGEESQAQPDVLEPSKPPGQQPFRCGPDEGTPISQNDAPLDFLPNEENSLEMAAACALLLLKQRPAISGAPTGEMVRQKEEAQQPLTPGKDSPPFWESSTQAIQLQPPEATACPPDSDENPFVPGLYPPSLIPPGKHSFFNLPALEPGVVPRAINLTRAMCYGLSLPAPPKLLSEVRTVLKKNSLSQQDADALAGLLERLISHCYHHQRTKVRVADYRRSCDRLIVRFLLLDAIVSGFSVLGQHPHFSWWQQFVQLMPHQYEMRSKKKNSKQELLAKALSKAVALLKTGVRPSDPALFKLKYMIFCSTRSTQRLDTSHYDSWRADCPDYFVSSQGGPSAK